MMELISYMDEHDKRFTEAVTKALRLIGGQGERMAKEAITDMGAVDTGFLRNSITYALAGQAPNIQGYTDDKGGQVGEYDGMTPDDSSGATVYVGTNVYYAGYVNFGTSKMPARPFLTQGVLGNQREIQELFRDAFDAFMG